MIAKLRACEHALAAGVGEVVIVDGRDGRRSNRQRSAAGDCGANAPAATGESTRLAATSEA